MSVVVLDASVNLAQVVPLPYSSQVDALMQRWRNERVRIIVPVLWEYEVVSGLRRACTHKIITHESVEQALNYLMDMRFEIFPGSLERHQRALTWAEKLGQSRAYDAQYMSLAEEFGAMLWTGDRRLANGASQLGVPWVKWVGDA